MSNLPFHQQPGQSSLSGVLFANGASAPTSIKSNLSASASPSVSNDNTQGYAVGSLWIDTTHNTVFTAASVATGAAVWVQSMASTVTGYSEVTLSNINLSLQKGVNNQFIDYSGTLSGPVVINLVRSGAVAGDAFYIRLRAVAGISGTNTLTIQENGTGSLNMWNVTTTALTRGIKAIFNGTSWETWDVAYPIDAGTTSGDMLYFDGSDWKSKLILPASPSSGDTLYFDGTSWVSLAKGTASQQIRMNAGATAPEWFTASASSPIPSGAIMDYGGTSAPSGWLLCDGSAVSRTTYSDLFTAISTNYGVGNGSTTFNVPDFRGRVGVGTGAGSGLTSRAIGATGGEETHALSEAELASHYHTYTIGSTGGGATQARNLSSGADASFNTSSVGSGTGHNTMQPFLVATKIIKT